MTNFVLGILAGLGITAIRDGIILMLAERHGKHVKSSPSQQDSAEAPSVTQGKRETDSASELTYETEVMIHDLTR